MKKLQDIKAMRFSMFVADPNQESVFNPVRMFGIWIKYITGGTDEIIGETITILMDKFFSKHGVVASDFPEKSLGEGDGEYLQRIVWPQKAP